MIDGDGNGPLAGVSAGLGTPSFKCGLTLL